MPNLVHLTSQEAARKIRKVGISLGRTNDLIYFLPVTQDHYTSHQWSRELRRAGIRNFAAVYFTLPDDLPVWHGRYNQGHLQEPLSTAIGHYLAAPDKLGYEFFTTSRVAPGCIRRVSDIRRPIGWRYHPGAHGLKPCGCPACRSRGDYGSAQIARAWQERNETPGPTIDEARRILASASDPDLLFSALTAFGQKDRREDPGFLFPLLEADDRFLRYSCIKVIGRFVHPQAKAKLRELLHDQDEDIREAAHDALEYRDWLQDPA